MNKTKKLQNPLVLVLFVSAIIFFVTFLLGIMEGVILSKIPNLERESRWNLLMSFIDFLLIVIAATSASRFYDKQNILRLIKMDLPHVSIAVLIGVVTFLLGETIIGIASKFLPSFSFLDEMFKQLAEDTVTTPDYVLLLTSVGILSPLAEEVFLRGFCYRVLRTKYKMLTSVLVVSLVFILFHPVPSWIPHLIIISIVLCVVFEYKRNLLLPFVVHSTINIAALVKLLSTA